MKAEILGDPKRKPQTTVDPARIPEALKCVHRWLVWQFVWNSQRKNWAKVPMNVRSGIKCNSTTVANWFTFDEALTAYLSGDYDGIGFALGDRYSGIDLDDCIDPSTGELSELARDIISTLDTYTERSPTGTGVKAICRGALPAKHKTKNKAGTIEIYTAGRFFCVTGDHVEGTPNSVEERHEQLTAVFERYIKNESKTHSASNDEPTSTAPDVDAEALAAMHTATKNMEDANDGSKRKFVAICRAKEHDLTLEPTIATFREYEKSRPFPDPWSEDDIRRCIADVEKRDDVVRGSAVVITNYRELEIVGDNGQPRKIKLPRSMSEIIADVRRRTKDWPRRVDNMLFVPNSDHGIDYFDRRTTAGLFGWLRHQFQVKWYQNGNFVSQAELFAEIERTAQRYDAIELLPHEKPIDGTYYRWPVPPAGDGKHLRWLLDRFRPETTIDRDLIQAAFMTPFWGGPPGTRPAIVITSDDGRGAGKTVLVQAIAYLCGGAIEASAKEDIGGIKTRLLTPTARTVRILLLDNVKTLKFSWADFEALLTSPVVSGKQLYVGDGQRPNLLTYFITLNGVSMATDMAQRSVIIKLLRGENSGPWWEETCQYIDRHRQAIIGDIVAALRADQKPLATYSRWATWEQHLLSRLPNPIEAQSLILERQGEANSELEEAQIIEEYFADQLRRFDYDPATAQVRIPAGMVAEWFNSAIGGQSLKTQAVSSRLNQMVNEKQLKRISADPSRTYGRCYIWTGSAANVIHDRITNDLVMHHKKRALALIGQEEVAV